MLMYTLNHGIALRVIFFSKFNIFYIKFFCNFFTGILRELNVSDWNATIKFKRKLIYLHCLNKICSSKRLFSIFHIYFILIKIKRFK